MRNTNEIDPEIEIHKSSCLNSLYNSQELDSIVFTALASFKKFFQSEKTRVANIDFYIMIIGISLDVIICFIHLYFQNMRIKNAKILSSSCLTLLPKNQVSQLADNLRNVKKFHHAKNENHLSDENNVPNRQDENIIKMFSSATIRDKYTANLLAFHILTILFFACYTCLSNCFFSSRN